MHDVCRHHGPARHRSDGFGQLLPVRLSRRSAHRRTPRLANWVEHAERTGPSECSHRVPQYMFDAVGVDADHDVGKPRRSRGTPVADLHHQGIDVEDRIDRIQRVGVCQALNFLKDAVGDLVDGVCD